MHLRGRKVDQQEKKYVEMVGELDCSIYRAVLAHVGRRNVF
jgi:hypothetical protein